MIHLIWSGRGFLVPVIAASSCLLMELTTRAVFQDDSYYHTQAWPIPTALAISGVFCFFVGRFINRGSPRKLVDIETGAFVVLPRSQHTFFFVPVQYWGPILFVIAISNAIYRIVNGHDWVP
jgi:hypothetical protein